jgi:hypothetical protein
MESLSTFFFVENPGKSAHSSPKNSVPLHQCNDLDAEKEIAHLGGCEILLECTLVLRLLLGGLEGTMSKLG